MPDELDLFSGTRNLQPALAKARAREAESQRIIDLMHELQLLLNGSRAEMAALGSPERSRCDRMGS